MKKFINKETLLLIVKGVVAVVAADGFFKFGQFVGWNNAMLSVSCNGYEETKEALGKTKHLKKVKETLDAFDDLKPIVQNLQGDGQFGKESDGR